MYIDWRLWEFTRGVRGRIALTVRRGRVRWHSKDRDEVYRKAVELRPGRFAILYTGRIPEDSAVAL